MTSPLIISSPPHLIPWPHPPDTTGPRIPSIITGTPALTLQLPLANKPLTTYGVQSVSPPSKHIHACVHARTHAGVRAHAHTHTRTHTHTETQTHRHSVNMQIYTCTHTHAHVHAHSYDHSHSLTYAHTQACTQNTLF